MAVKKKSKAMKLTAPRPSPVPEVTAATSRAAWESFLDSMIWIGERLYTMLPIREHELRAHLQLALNELHEARGSIRRELTQLTSVVTERESVAINADGKAPVL